jgi:catechol 2,3-dioxygenase-like lactoylglutathione lyase family enzyme
MLFGFARSKKRRRRAAWHGPITMIQRMSHTTIYVLDQDRAKAFYCDTLGFEVHTDAKMGDFRWLTVCPKGQPDLEIILMAIKPSPKMDEATCEQLRALVAKGAMGAGVFDTADIHKTYEELKAKGVHFEQAPTERPYGIEALFKDDSGNWFSMSQKP